MKSRAGLALIAFSGLCLALLGEPQQALAFDDCTQATSPAKGAPEGLWGALRPGDGSNTIPAERDTTDYTGSQSVDYRFPLFSSVRAVNDTVFTSYMYGFQIWDASGANALKPKLITERDQGRKEFLVNIGYQEERFLMWDVDTPPGVDSLLAESGKAPFGLSIWDTSNKTAPRQLYQDTNGGAFEVWAATIKGRYYAFRGAVNGQQQEGIHAYDMSKALERVIGGAKPCAENSAQGDFCGGVHLSWFAQGQPADYLNGVVTSGGRAFIASGGVGNALGIALWDVTNPSAPRNILGGTARLFPSEAVFGVALWEQGGRLYLALRSRNPGIRIHDVTNCLLSGSCSNPPLVWQDAITAPDFARVTFSKAGTIPMLWAGNGVGCVFDYPKEWVWDLRNLTTTGPEEITPKQTINVDGSNFGYWDWYSRFNRVTPFGGEFNGNILYRSAYTIFDAHEWVASDPTITVKGPATVYAGDPATFTAVPSVCTPNPTGWTWTTGGATGAGTSGAATLTWDASAIGTTRSVSATNSACPGAAVVAANVQILDPDPAIGSVTASPSTAYVCQPVTMTANSVTGKEPLSYVWTVKDGGGQAPPSFAPGATNPFTWTIDPSTPATPTGTPYTATVTVSGTGTPATKSTTITVKSLPALPDAGTFAPTNDPFASGTVQFHVNAPGATEWNWSFGDGSSTGWVSDPIAGPNPTHTYTAIGTYDVTVQVRNCIQAARTSSSLSVDITQVVPLTASFAAQCAFGICGFKTGQAITFVDSSTGADTWDYDWNGDGAFEDTGHSTPVTSHAYSQAGEYFPKLRVNRGAESKVFTHLHKITITAGTVTPPSLNINGPTSGQVDTLYLFTASASNCTAASTGWSWTTSGGVVSGASNTSSIQISWPSDGPKTLRVTNSGCSGAADSHSITIGSTTPPPGGGGGDGLTAAFSYAPTTPTAGQSVQFDASASKGSSLTYGWSFGDNSGAGSGKITTHTYSQAGTYQVTLSLGTDGCFSPGCPSDTLTKSITVGGGAPPFVASFDTSAPCSNQFGVNVCQATTGNEVTFTGTTKDADRHEWSFGDNSGTQVGKVVSHTWSAPGSYAVTYTASNGDDSDSITRTFAVTGPAKPSTHTVVLPWIAQADPDKALQQESDLYVYNPGPGPSTVEITFRKQGLPEPDPPHVTRTLQANQTLYLGDVMTDLFDRPNIKGFLVVEPKDGDGQPIVTSFNRTHDGDRLYGQVITGVELTNGTSARAAGTDPLHLVGLNDTDKRLGYFGITNPTDHRLDYQLQLFDSIGRPIGGPVEPSAVAAFSQKQYQVEEIRQQFGVDAVEDYRVTVKPAEGSGVPIPFGANLRLGSKDPSFVRVGRTDSSKVFIVGALDSGGLNGSQFQSDLVLSNTANDLVNYRMTFIGVGPFTDPSATIEDSLPAGETTRLSNVVSQWNTDSSLGVIEVESDSPDGIYPIVQGESYDISDPSHVYGQFMPALTLADAAQPGTPRSLVGLRQDADFINGTRSTVWLFNPDDSSATFTLHYLALDGTELGSPEEATLGGQKLRQVNPGFHPLPPEGAPQGFVVRVEVSKGKLLVAGQVVNEFNDPAYLVGR